MSTTMVPGLGERIALPVSVALYRYRGAPNHCPACGGLGFPWGGWFTCDEGCGAVALVGACGEWPAGQVFVPAGHALAAAPTGEE